MQGYLGVTVGCVSSGKTRTACEMATRFADLKAKVLYVNHQFDVRKTSGGQGDKFTSHSSSNIYLTEKVATVRVTTLEELKDTTKYDVIVIDEGQFYPDLVPVVMRLVEEEKKHVEVVGLDGDFNRGRIGSILDLIPKANKVKKLKATCSVCINKSNYQDISKFRTDALFSKKIAGNNEQVEVGGSEKYIAVCRYHYLHDD